MLIQALVIDNTSENSKRDRHKSGFSTTYHLHSLGQVMEKYKEFKSPLCITFIDYSKAFDSISHNSIWKTLSTFNINKTYINIIKYTYKNATSTVKLEIRGEDIRIERSVRQGEPLSPKLFIAVLEDVFQKLNWKTKGLGVGGVCLSHLRFADNIVVLAKISRNLEIVIQSLNQESARVGLEMNAAKTKIMTNSQINLIKPLGKRNVGRPAKRWADDIIKIAGRAWMNLAKDREIWKEIEETFTQTGFTYQEDN
ncbi:Retrovirus-related Pol polyprotein from type-1 retrotransposable element R2 [Eumeta japonica]|uniref:Retrovirus-related Pol polyprotein from type-1 retrotransposable element R2 n=1 Tax=Eumeta variegata TaxID=151549 RepID=A0A4C1YHU3_EUMVA|nr:Retrovirus-related Pol polyprotein from type-1 retrotransposable element R2 [Eumeta japonica]